jgi:hypothetical protein
MSKEQWGHGYYRGRREAFQPERLRTWVAMYDENGELLRAGRVVQNYPEDHILLEYWDIFDLVVFMSFGMTPGQEIDEDSLLEVQVTPGCKFFASWYGFLNDTSPAIWELLREVKS